MAQPKVRRNAQPAAQGFDFVEHIRRLSADMVARLPELAHICLDQVVFSTVQTRKATMHGIFAALHPLRFEQGSRFTEHRGETWVMPRVRFGNGQEILYIVRFYLPRFLNLPLREKLGVVLHELWHISPQFNGDVRRFPGRCQLHSAVSSRYDRQVEQLLDRYLAANPPEHLYDFLRYDFHQLEQRYGAVLGRRIRVPKPRRVRDRQHK